MAAFALAIPYNDNFKVDTIVRRGVPAEALRGLLVLLGIDRGTLAEVLGISRRTLDRRLAATSVLPFDEGDRVVRLGRILLNATEVFENQEKAARWFTQPLSLLGGATPIELCATDGGAKAVEQVLGRIEHGVFG